MKKLIIILLACSIFFIVLNVMINSKIDVVEKCKVLSLQEQTIISKEIEGNISTYKRHLVITDKETFISETNLLYGKVNNSDIFYRLKQDSTYSFKVVGIGKTIFTDYRNTLSYEKTFN